jgi:hypothetical protein
MTRLHTGMSEGVRMADGPARYRHESEGTL